MFYAFICIYYEYEVLEDIQYVIKCFNKWCMFVLIVFSFARERYN